MRPDSVSVSDRGICRWGFRRLQALRQLIGRLIAGTYLKLHGVNVGPGLVMSSLPFCRRHPDATIRLGHNVIIANRLSENPAGISHRTVLAANQPGARLLIGNHVGLAGVILICSKEIVIDDYVKLGIGVKVYDTDFHPIDAFSRRAHDVAQIRCAGVHICEDAWIGAEAMILKGVTIGARAVVGARALVTGDVPPDTVVGGVPARVIRRLDPDSRLCGNGG
jgi:acetyltransferase-like isoleucine patch superfamily enzyme